MHLDAAVAAQVLHTDDTGLPAVLRQHPVGPLLELFNVTWTWRSFPGARLRELGLAPARDALSDLLLVPSDDDRFWVPPLTARRLVRPDELRRN